MESLEETLEIVIVSLLLLLLFISTGAIVKPLTALALWVMNVPNIVIGKMLSAIPAFLR